MITQEKMYEVLYNNQEFVSFIINKHFKKAEPNEKTYSTMLKNNIYLKFLIYKNPKLKLNKIFLLQTLNNFDNKFWLKKDYVCYHNLLKLIKQNSVNINLISLISDYKLVNGYYGYLQQLNNITKIKEQTLLKINDTFENLGVLEATKLIVKLKLIK